jgi:DNA-binding transcriptional ArsR family regulator
MSARKLKPEDVFAALGDKTRLSLVGALSAGEARSITQLTEGTRLTRQAVTKHLRVLTEAGLVHRTSSGRETLFALDPKPLAHVRGYLEEISVQWEQALARLRDYVEN